MSDIIMIRHGQAMFGPENYDRLSERGARQARVTGEFLLKTGTRFSAMYSGSLERQKRTGEELSARLEEGGVAVPPVSIHPGFNEHNSKEILTAQFKMMLDEDPSLSRDFEKIYTDNRVFQKLFEKAMLRWISGRFACDGVESWGEFRRRVNDALDAVMRGHGKGSTIAVFASGGSIASAVGRVLDLSDEMTLRLSWQIANASITRFKFNEERISLSSFNCFAHLELEGDSSLVTYR